MKSIFKTSIYILCLTTSLTLAAGTKNLIDKEKVIEQTYQISSNDEIALENQFGSIDIEYHNANSVDIRVEVTASSTSADKAQKILDNIQIDHGKNSDGVYVTTKMEKKSKVKTEGKNY